MFFQPNELLVVDPEGRQLWSLSYNGRDGDVLGHKNISFTHIWCYVPLTLELETELTKICTLLKI